MEPMDAVAPARTSWCQPSVLRSGLGPGGVSAKQGF